jgi:hypothetical protein
MLNERFACFAPGWFINDKDPVYQAAWKRFYLAKSLPTEGNGWVTGTNLVVMTSTGRLLAGKMKYGDRTSLASALLGVLNSYARLPEADRLAASVESEPRPVPEPPPGGLVLTIYDRPLANAGGAYRLPQGDDLGGIRTHAPSGQRSSLWLTKEEAAALIPPKPAKGQTHSLPASLVKRICLYGLWPQTLWVVEHSWQPDSLRDGRLAVIVEEVSPKTVRLRVHGFAELSAKSRLRIYPTGKFAKDLENRYDAWLEGTIVYDRMREKIVRWDMVALGDYTGAMFTTREKDGKRTGDDQWREATAESPMPLAFAFELDETAYETPPERRRPRSFVHAYIFRNRERFYWEPDQWLADWTRRGKR